MKLHPEVIADHVRETSKRGSALEESSSRAKRFVDAMVVIICIAIVAAVVVQLIRN